MSGGNDPGSHNEDGRTARLREKVAHIAPLRAQWESITDKDFERHYRPRYFGKYRIARTEALRLLRRWEKEILERISAHEAALPRILWEVPSIQKQMWRHVVEFFVYEPLSAFVRPITARPARAEHMLVQDRFPAPGLLLALGAHIALLFVSVHPVTKQAFQKLDELTKDRTLTYYKLSEFLPEVFSPTLEKEFPKTAKLIPKQNQTIISNPPEPDNEFQTIIQPEAPKLNNLAEIKLPNIISVKPESPKPFEPPMPTLAPGSLHALDLPKDLLLPISPVLPPKKTETPNAELADITVAPSEALNPQPKLELKSNTQALPIEPLPISTLGGNTFSDVPVPKGPDSVPTVTPEIGRFTQVDAPNLLVLNVNPAPPEKDVKVPFVSRAASFSTEEGSGTGGNGGGKPGALSVPNITVTGGGLTHPGAAVVQTPRLPAQVAANIPPASATDHTRPESPSGSRTTRELNLPKPPRLSTDTLTKESPSESSSAAKKLSSLPREKKVYTTYLNLANLSSQRGSWVMRFSEYEDLTLSASKAPRATEDPEGELSAPQVFKSEHPKYPPQALFEKVEGEVVLTAIIRHDGTVDDVRVERSVDERLDVAAVEALRHWIFRPSQKNGKAVDVLAEITIPFYIKQVF